MNLANGPSLYNGSVKWLTRLSLVLGLWLFLSPWFVVSDLDEPLRKLVAWNYWTCGVGIAIFSLFASFYLKPWNEWMNILLGVWILSSPWVLHFNSRTGLKLNSSLVGGLIIILSLLVLPTAQKKKLQEETRLKV